ncbi:MAG: KUP/HAK/KT family potassium transporter [Saprospiraceae bacterium]|nr:KUP/HAK/KT family potassium transporter [Saprospiraceae bacterium]
MELSHEQKKAWTTGGVLIALGIVFGDIGTSPLYVIQAIVGDRLVTKELLYGGVSCVFWTLFIVSTVKYVILALNADNNGEGGIFALYARVRRYNPKLVIYPAMIGCATLIADGFITPPVSISSAVEGIHVLYPNVNQYHSHCHDDHRLIICISASGYPHCGPGFWSNYVDLVFNVRGIGSRFTYAPSSYLASNQSTICGRTTDTIS